MIKTVEVTSRRKYTSISSSKILNVDQATSLTEGFWLPFIAGKNHRICVEGPSLDLCDNVEICDRRGKILRTIRGNDLFKSNPGYDINTPPLYSPHSDYRRLVFFLDSSDLPSINTKFKIRVRYPLVFMGGGYDQLNCKVTRRGKITAIKWVGDKLPIRIGTNRDAILRPNETYKLQFFWKFFCGWCRAWRT